MCTPLGGRRGDPFGGHRGRGRHLCQRHVRAARTPRQLLIRRKGAVMAPRSVFRIVAALSFVFGISAVSGRAFAQGGDSGAITGYVFDQAGNPLSGVKITATSPTQIGGRKTAYAT